MKIKGNWIPKKFVGIEFDNQVAEEFDTEKHPISASLGNEDGQNKIDATLLDKKGKVSITHVKTENNLFFKKYLESLKKHLKYSEDGYREEKIPENKTDFLIIEDFNTYGLTGDFEKTRGDRYQHFFLTFSKSKGGKQLGRRGQGRNVYWIASYIRAFFGYSIQHDSGKKLLRGIAHPGQTTIGEDNYHPYMSYTVPYEGNEDIQNERETRPIVDEQEIKEFIKSTGIQRKNEPGLSIVIPYPHERVKLKNLKDSYLKRFYAAILFNKMELEVNKEIINDTNVKKHLSSIGININQVDFIYESRSTPEKEFIKIDLSETPELPDKLNFQNFLKNHLEKIRYSYYNSETLSFRVYLNIPYKKKAYENSYFNFHLKRGESSEGTTKMPALFMRGFLQLPEMSSRFKFSSKCLAYFWADHEHISTMLGDSEGKAHLKFDPRHKDIDLNYDSDAAKKIFDLINNCMNETYKLITETKDEVDFDKFSNFVPKIKSDEFYELEEKNIIDDFDLSKKSQKTKMTKKKKRKKVLARKMVEDSQIEGGFKIIKMSTTEKKEFPMLVRSTCAYNVRRGNPILAYSPDRHFQINQGEVKVTKMEKIKDLKVIDGNRIEFVALEEDFAVEVTGFDTSRKDIYVKTRKLKDSLDIKKIKNG